MQLTGDFFSGISKGFEGLGTIFSGMSATSAAADYSSALLNQSGQEALQAGQYTAGVYRQAEQITRNTTEYNIAAERYNYARQNDATSRQLKDMFSSNRAMMGASGIGLGSGSYLSVQSAVLDRMTSQAIQMHNATIQRQKMIDYNGMLTEYDYENKAVQAEYSAKVQDVNYRNQAQAEQYKAEVANSQASSAGFSQILGIGKNILSGLS